MSLGGLGILATRNAETWLTQLQSTVSVLSRIQQRIIDRDYYLSSHAEEEMMDDGPERADVESAILKGFLKKNDA